MHFLVPRQKQFASLNESQGDVVSRYGAHVLTTWLLVLAAHAALGLLLGAAASLVLRAWDAALERSPSRKRRWVEVLALVFLAESWAVALTIVRYPQPFAAWLYERGGLARALQLALTEKVSPLLLEALGASVLAVLVLGPLAFWRAREAFSPILHGRKRAAAGSCVVLGGLALVFFLGGSDRARAGGGSRPNLLVLGVDSLRVDRLSRERAALGPRIASLCERGVVFREMHVSLPLTFPSIPTILTGRFPQHHGIRHMFPSLRARAGVGPTIATRLRERGYRTAFAIDEGVDPLTSLDLGFGEGAKDGMSVRQLITSELVQRELALLPLTTTGLARRVLPALQRDWSNFDPDRLADRVIEAVRPRAGEPFFVFGFFAATHFPYASPWPHYRKLGRADYAGPYRYHVPVLPEWPLGKDDQEQVSALYDGALSATDAAIGRVLDAVAASGLAERTIVVLLADHGENLGERGRGIGHSDHLHGENAVRAPLVIVDPVHRFPAHVVSSVVRDVDIARTLASLVGERLDGTDGVDLGELLSGERRDLELDACSESSLVVSGSELTRSEDGIPFPVYPSFITLDQDEVVMDARWEDLSLAVKERAIRSGKWKLIYQPRRGGAVFSLHDLEADPEEELEVGRKHPEVVSRLKEKLYGWMTLDGSLVREDGLVVPRGFEVPK